MRYPELVPDRYCKTDIRLEIDREGLTGYGEPLEPVEYEGKCNWQDGAKTVLTDRKKTVQASGTALFNGDICPELATIPGGFATVNGMRRRIVQGTKARNPDGTVNYTEVLLE